MVGVIMKKIKGTLVILTRNEIEGLNKMFNKIPVKQVSEVICIDGKSTDGTREFLKKKKVRVLVQKKMGRGEAFRIANKVAKHENLVFFSPDGNEDPKDIPKLFNWMDKGYDMVIASRFMPTSRADDSGDLIRYRSFGNRAFTLAANILFRGRLYDSINGFRGIKKKKFAMINPDAEGFGIEYQVSMRAMKLRMRIKEIPTIEAERIGGQSTAYTFRTGFYFIRLILKELFLGKRFVKRSRRKKR
jgi:glycosyltransferase involved in cell wall biosynthesis